MKAWRFAPFLLALLAACQPQPSPGLNEASVTAWPEFDFQTAAENGASVFSLDPAVSTIDIIVRREGPLARFGHDHVVSVREVEGYLLLLEKPGEESRAELRFRVDRMEVDAADARIRYQLDTDPDVNDIDATRRNMLEQVFDSEHWPYVSIVFSEIYREETHYSALLRTTVRGSRASKRQAFRLSRSGNGITAEGAFTLLQTELGIEPFSTLGGSLRVADQLEIHFRLVSMPM